MDVDHKNPLEIAGRLGHSIAGDLGSEAFSELEMSYVTRLFPKFSDNPLLRMRQHLLLYWDQSYLKSTIIDQFSRSLPHEIISSNISSMSPEALFGSITEDRKWIVRPIFAQMNFAKIDELLSFLGSGNTLRDIVNTMNTVMEGNIVTRYLLKLGQPDFAMDIVEQLRKEGLNYDPHRARLSYQPDVCIWAASRPMDNRTYTYLRLSGHLYRYHVLQHRISDREAERYFTEDLRPDMKLQDDLSTLNQRLAKITVKDMRAPDKPILSQIATPLIEIVKDEIAFERRRLAEIIDIRTKGDIIRELTAHAFLRTAIENEFKDIEKLEYTSEDIEFILRNLGHFIEFKINPLFTDEFIERGHKKRPRDQVKEIVLELLSDGNVRQRREIDDYVSRGIKVGFATISNALEDLKHEGKICQPKYGFYKSEEDCNSCKLRDSCLHKNM